MRIPSGVTDQYIYFVAVDSNDLKTRETGLTGFTVYRSRDGAAAAAMTTPTVNETDATNMPGVYELLADEDMTIAAGNDSEEMCFHITATGMAPVTRTIELYRPKVTAGNTLDVTATGAAGVDWGNVENPTTSVDLSATSINLVDTSTDVTNGVSLSAGAITDASLAGNMEIVFETDFATNYNTTRNAWATNVQDQVGTGNLPANAAQFGGQTVTAAAGVTVNAEVGASSTAMDAFEDQYDGTGLTGDTYPATQSQVGSLTSGTAAINTVARPNPDGFVITTGLSEVNTEDSTHALDGTTHDLEDSAGTTDCYYIFDVGGNGVPVSATWNGYVNANNSTWSVFGYNWAGTAWEQIGTIIGANGTTIVTETFSFTNAHVGTGANLGLVRLRFQSTDGTKIATDRLVCSYAVVSQSVGYANGAVWVDTVNGTAGTESYVNGTADNPVLTWADAKTILSNMSLSRISVVNGSSITLDSDSSDLYFYGEGWTLALGGQSIASAYFNGADITGISSGSGATFEDCNLGAVTIAAATFKRCGIGVSDGLFTAAVGSGEYVFEGCYSVVAGSGTPDFDFSPVTAASGINNRGWLGGSSYTLDSNCTLSHEVLAGGGTTVVTGGGNAEIRGITRSLTITMSAAETVQFVGTTGPISLNGTTTATVNLYGVAASVTDSTSAATVTNDTVSQDTVNAEVDTALADYDGPTNAEMEARTLVAANYFDPAADTVANVTTVATVTNDVGVNEWNGVALGTTNPLPNAAAGAAGGLPTDSTGKTAFNDPSVSDILTTQMTEAYATDGTAPTLAQAQFQIMQFLHESSVAGTTYTVKGIDGTTTKMTFTLNDGTTPTSITRAT